MAKILLVTSKQPSTNPRIRKSADALSAAGHDVHLQYEYSSHWASHADLGIFADCQWSHNLIGGHPRKSWWTYYFNRAKAKWARWRGKSESHFSPCAQEHLRLALLMQPDVVIGHNPGMLPVLAQLKACSDIPVIFDAEDYHRGEFVSGSFEALAIEQLESTTFPMLDGVTFASPLFELEYKRNFTLLNTAVIHNSFSRKHIRNQIQIRSAGDPLKIVWFSQVVGLDRGLLEFLVGMNRCSSIPIELTIVGSCSTSLKDAISKAQSHPHHQLQFCSPLPESELFAFIADHEIGLALEVPDVKNRDLCWTNKLFVYPLCGCLTLMSDTTAQVSFHKEHPMLGEVINLRDPSSIEHVIRAQFDARQELFQRRLDIVAFAEEALNWESDSLTLVNFVQDILAKPLGNAPHEFSPTNEC